MRRARSNSWDDEEENGVASFSGNASVEVAGPSLSAQDKAFFAEIGQHVISALTDDLNNVDADYEERSGVSTMDSSVKEWFENKLTEVFGVPWRIDAESQFGDLHAKTRTILLMPYSGMSAPSNKWQVYQIIIESTSGRTASSPLKVKVTVVPRPAHAEEELRELTEEDFEAIPNRSMRRNIMSRRNPFSTGYVAAKIRANSALRNGNVEIRMQSRDEFEESLAATDRAGLDAVMAALNYLADCAHEGKSKEQLEKEITGMMRTCARQFMSR